MHKTFSSLRCFKNFKFNGYNPVSNGGYCCGYGTSVVSCYGCGYEYGTNSGDGLAYGCLFSSGGGDSCIGVCPNSEVLLIEEANA